MLDNSEVTDVASGLSTLLLDFGDWITNGKGPPRTLVWTAWVGILGGGLALWRWFPWLFDHLPGWAVIAGGSWLILLIIGLGLFGATVKHGGSAPPS